MWRPAEGPEACITRTELDMVSLITTSGDLEMATTTKFETTIKALGDITKLKPEAAVKNIEGWEEFLSKHEVEGAKKLTTDLDKLKKLLTAEELDDTKIKALMQKLGKETAELATHAKGAEAEHVKKLGTALQEAL